MKRLINGIKIELAMIALGVTLCVSSKVYAKSIIIPTPTTTPNTPITTTTDSNISKATLGIINTETEPEINNAVTNTITNNNTTTPTQSTSAKTEEQVIAKINELKAKYPENSQWKTSDIYNSSHDFNTTFYESMTEGQGSYKSNATGTTSYSKDCAAWATWVSDQIFGNAPTTKHSNYNAIKVGDLIHEGEDGNSTNGSHWSVVVDIKYDENGEKYFVITDSDDTRYVNWSNTTLMEWQYNPDYPRNEIMNNYLGEYAETGLPFQVYSRY